MENVDRHSAGILTSRPFDEPAEPAEAGAHPIGLGRGQGLPRAGRHLAAGPPPEHAAVWTASLRERATCVVYCPRTELQSDYVEGVPPEQFGACVWLEETRAVTPLEPAEIQPGESETFPTRLSAETFTKRNHLEVTHAL